MSLLDVYQKTDPKYPAFSGVINNGVSEAIETDEDVLIPIVSDHVPERSPVSADEQVIRKYADSEKWCGDERTKYTVLKVEATSFILAVCVALALVLVNIEFPGEFSFIGP